MVWLDGQGFGRKTLGGVRKMSLKVGEIFVFNVNTYQRVTLAEEMLIIKWSPDWQGSVVGVLACAPLGPGFESQSRTVLGL